MEWQLLQPHNNRPWAQHSPICFLCSAIGVARLWCTVFPYLEVGWTSGFSGARKRMRGIGNAVIVESMRWGERTSMYNYNPTSSSANTSCFEKLVPIFTSHVLDTTCQSNMFFFATNYTTFDVFRAKPKLILHIIGRRIFLLQSLVRRSRGAMFSSPDFGVAKSPNIALHCSTSFGKVRWQSCNVPMGRGTIIL